MAAPSAAEQFAVAEQIEAALTPLREQVGSLQTRISLLETAALPSFTAIVTNILLKVGASHLFWSLLQRRWLTVEEVERREQELAWLRYKYKGVRIEEQSKTVLDAMKVLEEDRMNVVKTQERLQWESRLAQEKTVTSLSPTTSALKASDTYPAGRTFH
ncbi:hypothetical protein B0H19DRAFT_1261691 [Mycena capillaripes]|nr:hypothetical protein B0H19DRAFT_1261691 [Mycena capillaripes]